MTWTAKTVSPGKGENQSPSISAMKGETHSAKETADVQGETNNKDDKLPRLIPRGTPGYESGDESEDEEDVIDYKSPMLDPPLKKNPSDILSKHWDMPSVWDSLKPLLFWRWTNAEKPPRNGSKKDTVATDSKTESTKTGSV